MPLSLLGGSVFLYLSVFFWKAGRHQTPGLLKRESTLLPREVFMFFCSFVVGTIAFILLSLFLVVLAVKTTLSDWTSYILYPLSIAVGVYVGVAVYKRLARINV